MPWTPTPLNADDLALAWKKFDAEQTRPYGEGPYALAAKDAEAALVGHYLDRALAVARQMQAIVGRQADIDDLTDYAAEGLLSAIRNFRAKRGPFIPFALTKMRQAVLNGLRDEGEPRRWVASAALLFGRSVDGASAELGHPATVAEVADFLGLEGAKRRWFVKHAKDRKHVSLDAVAETQRVDEEEAMTCEDAGIRAVDDADSFAALVRHLHPLERQIATLHYRDKMLLKDIAKVLNLDVRRVWTMRQRLLVELREALGQEEGEA